MTKEVHRNEVRIEGKEGIGGSWSSFGNKIGRLQGPIVFAKVVSSSIFLVFSIFDFQF